MIAPPRPTQSDSEEGGETGLVGAGREGGGGVFSYREDDDVCGVDLLPVGIAPCDCGDGEECD